METGDVELTDVGVVDGLTDVDVEEAREDVVATEELVDESDVDVCDCDDEVDVLPPVLKFALF